MRRIVRLRLRETTIASRMRVFAAALLVSVGCGSADGPGPSGAPVEASTYAAPAPSAPASSAPDTEGAFGPRQLGCVANADCGLDFTYLIDGKCCRGTCSPEPASGAYLTKAEHACESAGWETERCPMKKCVAPPEVLCVEGRCVFDPAVAWPPKP